MEDNQLNQLSPNYVPEEYRTPYDVLELPSQGILYENNKKTVKVEYLTAMDETILTSPNISSGSKIIDILLKRKVKDLGFEVEDLLTGDRTTLMMFLRITSFGEEYKQLVFDSDIGDYVEAIIDLTKLEQKKLTVKPNQMGEFEYKLPKTNRMVTFTLLTGRDEEIIDQKEKEFLKRNKDGVSNKIIFTLEQQIKSIDGERDKIKISNIIKKLPIIDSRSIRKYIEEITPGINLKTTARTDGGKSLDTFLRFGSNFFFPEL
jgi:hypothetical protein